MWYVTKWSGWFVTEKQATEAVITELNEADKDDTKKLLSG